MSTADDEIGLNNGLFDVVAVAVDGVDATAEDVVELAEAVQVHVEQGDLRAHAEGDLRGVGADDAAADDADVAGSDAGDAAEEDAAPAMLLLKIGGADLDAHASGDLAHRDEEGQGSEAVANGLVGDACDLFVEQGIGETGDRGEMQVGEEDEALAEVAVLFFDRFLDLDDHLGETPDVVG